MILTISSLPTHFSSVRKSFYLLPWKPFSFFFFSPFFFLSFCFCLLLSSHFFSNEVKESHLIMTCRVFGLIWGHEIQTSRNHRLFFFLQGINIEWVAAKEWRRKRYLLSADCVLVTVPAVFTYPASHMLQGKSAGQAGKYYDPILQKEKQVSRDHSQSLHTWAGRKPEFKPRYSRTTVQFLSTAPNCNSRPRHFLIMKLQLSLFNWEGTRYPRRFRDSPWCVLTGCIRFTDNNFMFLCLGK